MEDEIKQIGHRIIGLRDVLELTQEGMAEACGLPLDKLQDAENGVGELSVSMLQKIARQYDIPLDVLMFGEEPRMLSYHLTRKNHGLNVERRKAYSYELLGYGFRNRKADPFLVTVAPKETDEEVPLNSHDNQEFNLVLRGRLEITIGKKTLVLEEGDSIYYDCNQPHGMRALDDKEVKFLCVVI
ncbi:MAG TPA: cupin domain-containing protein [Bacteroidaceae bacterium]|nr:cupin domain-containing protein [Bacteroidaceae bacterium]